jgi:ADP-heptose:LPS heptosyltransferase
MKIVEANRPNASPTVPIHGGLRVQFESGRAIMADEVAQALIGMAPTFYRIVGESIPQNIAGSEILVIRNRGLGDVLLTTPLVRELASQGAIVDVLTEARYVCLWEGNPHVRHVLPIEVTPIERDKYSAVLDLREHVENLDLARRELHRCDGFAEYCDVKLSSHKLDYFLRDEEREEAGRAIGYLPHSDRPTIAYIWRASHDTRVLSQKKHESVLKALTDAGLRVLICDHEPIPTPDYPGVVNLTSQLSIRQLAAVMANCACVVAPDTGAFHLASALDIPIVAYFSTMPIGYRGTHQKLTMVDSRQNCALFPCRRYSCLNRDDDRMVKCLDFDIENLVQGVMGWVGSQVESKHGERKRRNAGVAGV